MHHRFSPIRRLLAWCVFFPLLWVAQAFAQTTGGDGFYFADSGALQIEGELRSGYLYIHTSKIKFFGEPAVGLRCTSGLPFENRLKIETDGTFSGVCAYKGPSPYGNSRPALGLFPRLLMLSESGHYALEKFDVEFIRMEHKAAYLAARDRGDLKSTADWKAPADNPTDRTAAGPAPARPAVMPVATPSVSIGPTREQAERDRLIAEANAARLRQAELEAKLAAAEARARALSSATDSGRAQPPAERRVALVIGNAAYKSIQPLRNPTNDADDVAQLLSRSGFDVQLVKDATLSQMRAAARKFHAALTDSAVALVYYSGHGMEVEGRNYLLPVNADIEGAFEVADQAYDAEQLLKIMNSAGGMSGGRRVNLMFLDACRNNNLPTAWRSVGRGLARMEAPAGTLVAFATAPGQVAADGDDRNSPYTRHLLRLVRQQPGQPIEQLLKLVRRAVMDETAQRQIPWENSSLVGDFSFAPPR